MRRRRQRKYGVAIMAGAWKMLGAREKSAFGLAGRQPRPALLPVLAAALLFSSAVSMPVQAESLSAALSAAYRNNPQLMAERANLRATDEGVAKAKSGWRPRVSVNGQMVRGVRKTTPLPGTSQDYNSQQIGITLQQPLFDGFKTAYGVKAAKAQVKAGRQNLLATEQQVLLDAVLAYMNVVRDAEIVRLRKVNVKVLRQQLRATRDRFNVGDVTRTDVSQARAALAGAQAQLAQAQAELANSRAAYEEVVGHKPRNLRFPRRLPKTLPRSLRSALDIAARRNPQVVAAAFGEQAARHAVEVAFGDLLPKLNLQAGLSYSRNKTEGSPASKTRDANIALALDVPLYSGGYNHANVREARHKAEAASLQVAVARRAVQKSVVQAWYNLQAAKRLISAATAQVQAARLAYQGVLEEYKAGSRTTLDVLNARQALNNARVELVKARAAKVSSAYALLAAMGGLTAARLGLAVARHDAAAHYERVKNKPWGTRD